MNTERWTVRGEQWGVDSEGWTVSGGQWGVDSEGWTVRGGQWGVHGQWGVDSEGWTLCDLTICMCVYVGATLSWLFVCSWTVSGHSIWSPPPHTLQLPGKYTYTHALGIVLSVPYSRTFSFGFISGIRIAQKQKINPGHCNSSHGL